MVAIEYRQTSAAAPTTTTTISSISNNQLSTSILSPTASASLSVSSSSSSTTITTSTSNSNLLQQQPQEQNSKDNQKDLTVSPTSPELPIEQNFVLIEDKMSSNNDDKEPEEPQHSKEMASDENKDESQTKVPQQEPSKSAVSQRSVDLKIEKSTNQLSKKVLKLDLSGKELNDFSVKSPKSPIAARLPHQVSLTSSVDVEDRKTLREALYQGIFHRHRKTIFAMGSFLRMLRSRNSSYNTIRSSSEGEDIDEVR